MFVAFLTNCNIGKNGLILGTKHIQPVHNLDLFKEKRVTWMKNKQLKKHLKDLRSQQYNKYINKSIDAHNPGKYFPLRWTQRNMRTAPHSKL